MPCLPVTQSVPCAFGHQVSSACLCSRAGLGRGTTVAVKRNVHTLKLTFTDPHHVIASGAGAMLQLTGHTKDVPTGLNVCFTASVGVC